MPHVGKSCIDPMKNFLNQFRNNNLGICDNFRNHVCTCLEDNIADVDMSQKNVQIKNTRKCC